MEAEENPLLGLIPIVCSWTIGTIMLIAGLVKNNYFPNNINWSTIIGICLIGIATVAFIVGDKITTREINKTKYGKEKPSPRDLCLYCKKPYKLHEYGNCPDKE